MDKVCIFVDKQDTDENPTLTVDELIRSLEVYPDKSLPVYIGIKHEELKVRKAGMGVQCSLFDVPAVPRMQVSERLANAKTKAGATNVSHPTITARRMDHERC